MSSKSSRPLRLVLRSARLVLGMTQKELADALLSSRRTVIRWERGQSQPSDDELRRLAGLLGADEPELADEVLAAVRVPISVESNGQGGGAAASPSIGVAATAAPLPDPTTAHRDSARDPPFMAAEAAAGASGTAPHGISTPTLRYLVDAVLFAAADAMNAAPRDVRPALAAAFARARDMGLTIEQVADALAASRAERRGGA